MEDVSPETLKHILQRVENRQETDDDRQFLIQFLRDFLMILETMPNQVQLPDTLAVLRASNKENKRLFQALERRIFEQESIRQVSLNLTSSLDLKQVLRAVLTETFRLVSHVSDAHIFLFDSGKLSFGAALYSDGRETLDQPLFEPRPHGLVNTVAHLGDTISVPDMRTHPMFLGTNWSGSIIGIPLKIGPRVVGVMTACRQPAQDFSADDLRLLDLLADHAAIAIENARLHNLVDQQAHLDSLTGLFNRRSLNEHLEAEVTRYRAAAAAQDTSGSPMPFALLMMDLDGFKLINDTYGHLAGDYVLKEISIAVSQALRKSDFLARFGGDEMALLLGDTDSSTAEVIAARVQDFVSKVHFNFPNLSDMSMTISIGLAIYPDNASTVVDLIEAADHALYEAKHQRAGGVVVSGKKVPPAVSD